VCVSPGVGRKVLGAFPGVKVLDDPAAKVYPMPLTATNQHDVEVRTFAYTWH
jgi:aspartate-semialdehyde dehydrogenase